MVLALFERHYAVTDGGRAQQPRVTGRLGEPCQLPP